MAGLINANPTVYDKKERRVRSEPREVDNECAVESIDQLEIFDILISLFLYMESCFNAYFFSAGIGFSSLRAFQFSWFRDIKDPEHPYSLEQLKVITEDSIEVDGSRNHIRVTFTPTVEHCSMVTVIGLCLRVKLLRSLPSHFKVDIRVAPGTHATEAAVNKQLNDKERVAAALENPNLVEMVDECLAPSFY